MKLISALLLTFFSLSAFASDIAKEIWTCRNNSMSFTAVVTEVSVENKLDSQFQWEDVSLELEAGKAPLDGQSFELSGEFYQGYDSYNYQATLVRSAKDPTKGKLTLITDMFIDCRGQAVETDVVNCTIVSQKK